MNAFIFKESSSAIKWLIDSLLKLNQSKRDLETKKIEQISEYLQQISEILDKVVLEIKNDNLPSREYYELDHISYDIYSVLSDLDKKWGENFSIKFRFALSRAIHNILTYDFAKGYEPGGPNSVLIQKLYSEKKPFGRTGKIIVEDLKQVAALFSAESKKLKAKK